MNKIFCLTLALLCALACIAASSLPVVELPIGFELNNVKRTININTNIEEQSTEFTVENHGENEYDYFVVATPESKNSNLALIEAVSMKSNKALIVTQVDLTSSTVSLPKNALFYKVQLAGILKPRGFSRVRVTISYTHTLTPVPATIKQSESQFMKYSDYTYVFAGHPVKTQTTLVRLFSSNVISFTPKKEAKHSDKVITYGPYSTEIPAFTTGAQLTVHSENNFPFATMRTATRDMEISHWGNVAVTENYLLQHTGAQLSGEFLRSSYQGFSPAAKGVASFATLSMVLPLAATDIYFRDHIGNISTSNVRQEPSRNRVHVDVTPRYPLFGGWKADLELGYNIPTKDVLFTVTEEGHTDDILLDIPFGVSFEYVSADELVVRVILPEGSTNIRWATPFEVDDVSFDIVMTYLDTVGRPVVVIKKVNVVAGHVQNFQVLYSFPKYNLWREPGILIGAVFLFLVLTMLYVRLDLSLGAYSEQPVPKHEQLAEANPEKKEEAPKTEVDEVNPEVAKEQTVVKQYNNNNNNQHQKNKKKK